MTTISIYKFDNNLDIEEIIKAIDGVEFEDNSYFLAKQSKYCNFEVFIQYFYHKDIQKDLEKLLSATYDGYEIIDFLKKKNKLKVLDRVFIFLNTFTKTLEIYENKNVEEILTKLKKLLKVDFEPVDLPNKEFYPDIKLLDNRKYKVKTKGNKLMFKKNGIFFKPRFEIRQILYQIVNGGLNG